MTTPIAERAPTSLQTHASPAEGESDGETAIDLEMNRLPGQCRRRLRVGGDVDRGRRRLIELEDGSEAERLPARAGDGDRRRLERALTEGNDRPVARDELRAPLDRLRRAGRLGIGSAIARTSVAVRVTTSARSSVAPILRETEGTPLPRRMRSSSPLPGRIAGRTVAPCNFASSPKRIVSTTVRGVPASTVASIGGGSTRSYWTSASSP